MFYLFHNIINFLGIVGQLMRKVLRLANEEDFNKLKKNRVDEVIAHYIFKHRVKAFNLEMKLIDVEYQFARNRLTFYFTASGGVEPQNLHFGSIKSVCSSQLPHFSH